jgi:hypothetical protein
MKKRLTSTVIVGLILAGLLLAASRHWAQRRGLLTTAVPVWRLELTAEVLATRDTARLYVPTPADTATCRLFRQRFSHPGWRSDPSPTIRLERRLRCDRRPPATLSYRAGYDIYLIPPGKNRLRRQTLTADQRAMYLRAGAEEMVQDASARQTLARLRKPQQTKAELLNCIFEHCANMPAEPSLSRVVASRPEVESSLAQARTMLSLCRVAKFPARLVTGIELKENGPNQLCHWVEVYLKRQWLPYDPLNGYDGELPRHFLPLTYGSGKIFRVRGGARLLRTSLSMRQIPSPPDCSMATANPGFRWST